MAQDFCSVLYRYKNTTLDWNLDVSLFSDNIYKKYKSIQQIHEKKNQL